MRSNRTCVRQPAPPCRPRRGRGAFLSGVSETRAQVHSSVTTQQTLGVWPASASQKTTTLACGPQDSGGFLFLRWGHMALMLGVWSLCGGHTALHVLVPVFTAGLITNSHLTAAGTFVLVL